MCGISVVLSKQKNKKAIPLLLTSLEQLQNRGYDSFGLSSIIDSETPFNIHKVACTSSVKNFEYFKEKTKDIESNVVMGHTRWATHGIISDENAHPHVSMTGTISLVHNGIIENYKSIKALLIENGYIFNSQTDSEVIANLIDYHYTILNEKIEDAIQTAIHELSGTYGLAIQCLDYPENTYIIRNGSPLLVGENDDYIMATSEVSGFVNQMKHYYTLTNNDLICFSLKEGIKSKKTQLKKMECRNENIVLTPAPYPHWTLKEIHEQKDSLLRATNNGGRILLNKIKLGGIGIVRDYIREIENILLIGCGTSLHACQIGAFYLKKYQCGIVNHISVFDAAEFTPSDIPKRGKSLVIIISQSGETMDLHRVLPFVKERGCLTMGIINVVDSLIAREVHCGIYMNAGRENAVASTKSFTSSLIILKMFSLWFYQEYMISESFMFPSSPSNSQSHLLREYEPICNNIRNVIEQVGTLNSFSDENEVFTPTMVERLNQENIFILGKGKMECVAKEAALKLKEICYIHAEAYSGSALKHGPFALLKEGFPVIFLIDKENKDKMLNAYQEVKSRKAYCLVISELPLFTNDVDVDVDVKNIFIRIPENGDIQEILYMVVLQHLCYSISQRRGINPDNPRNLAKVVTVE
jgi:glucosamine--fructose-6-phosphate aminotransferase (isomerizing)